MYCKEDEYVSRHDLAGLSMQRMGPRHNPTSFYLYASRVADEFALAGYTIEQEEYVLTKDKQTFFGAMHITHPELDHIDDFKVTVGMRGSHVQKIPRGLLIGESVIVCSNLCFHGDLGNWKTKQTTNIESRLPDIIRAAVDTLPELVEARRSVISRMKDQRVTDRWGDAKLVDLWRRGGLSGNELPRALSEWVNPSFDHGDDLTIWRLFNAATQALKPTGAGANMQTVTQRSRICSDELKKVVE